MNTVVIASSIGALLVLAPYWLVSAGRLKASSRAAASLNLVSSFAFLIAHVPTRIWGSVVLDVVWGGIAIGVLVKNR